MARPSKFTKKLGDKILNLMVDGLSLKTICKDPKMPHRATVFRWLAKEEYKEFCDMYTRAREAQAEMLADEIVDIADDSNGDVIATESGIKIDGDCVQRAKLRIHARQWYAGKLKPRSYGDKSQVDLNGSLGGGLTVEIVEFKKPEASAA